MRVTVLSPGAAAAVQGADGHARETHCALDLVCAGDRVQLLKSIWDGGEDHHPPGWLAMAGEMLVVRSVGNIGAESIAVSHDGAEESFWISRDEWTKCPRRTAGDAPPCASSESCNHRTHLPTPAAP